MPIAFSPAVVVMMELPVVLLLSENCGCLSVVHSYMYVLELLKFWSKVML